MNKILKAIITIILVILILGAVYGFSELVVNYPRYVMYAMFIFLFALVFGFIGFMVWNWDELWDWIERKTKRRNKY